MRCTAEITINGERHQCRLEIGDEHFRTNCDPPAAHEAKITSGDGKTGMIVQWSHWRLVQPAATPAGIRANE